MKRGFVRPSKSSHSSPIVLDKKKNGKLGLCVDFRALNKITVCEHFPLPRIDDPLDRLQGKEWFTELDLKDGFHHIKMAENPGKCTAFSTPKGQYEYL